MAALRALGLAAASRRTPHAPRPSTHAAPPPRPARRTLAPLRAKPSLADQLLDVMEGGPKLRRWYGAEKKTPRDGGGDDEPGGAAPEPQEEDPADATRDAVLVSEADSAVGEAVVFALIVASARVKLLCRDTAAASTRFGAYVTPVLGEAADEAAVRRALRGTACVVITGAPGALPAAAAAAGVAHVVLLSAAPAALPAGPLAGLLRSAEDAARSGPAREAAVRAAGVPCTVVRAGALRDAPGGKDTLLLSSRGGVTGSISREDAAAVCAAAALGTPPASGRTFEVCAQGGATPPDAATLPPAGGDAWRDALLAALPQDA